MLTWHLDRLVRSATLCLAAAVVITGAMGFVIKAGSDVSNVLGGLLVGAIIIGVGGIVGSIGTTGFGALLFSFIASLANPGAATLLLAGCVVVIALLLVDLSITLRRAPLIDRSVWIDSVMNAAVISALGAALFGVAWLVGTLATWQAVVLPFGVVALGYAVRLAADAHTKRYRS